MAEWSKYVGLGGRLAGIAGLLVAGGVIMTALTATEVCLWYATVPIGR